MAQWSQKSWIASWKAQSHQVFFSRIFRLSPLTQSTQCGVTSWPKASRYSRGKGSQTRVKRSQMWKFAEGCRIFFADNFRQFLKEQPVVLSENKAKIWRKKICLEKSSWPRRIQKTAKNIDLYSTIWMYFVSFCACGMPLQRLELKPFCRHWTVAPGSGPGFFFANKTEENDMVDKTIPYLFYRYVYNVCIYI